MYPPPSNQPPHNQPPYNPPGGPQQVGPIAPGPAPLSPAEERNWGVACHLASLCGYIGIPFGHILGPLVVWLMKKDASRFIDEVGKETVNYNISLILWMIICIPFVFILIGFFFIGALALMDIIVTILAAVAASHGQQYRYPLTIHFIS